MLVANQSDRVNFAGTGTVSVKFQSDEALYHFPEEALVKNFRYFRAAFQSGFLEGQSKHVHLECVSARDFGTLFKWLQEDLLEPSWVYKYNKRNKKCRDIDHILQSFIAACYLDMGNPHLKSFADYLARQLSSILIVDRCLLTPRHIKLVETHPAFGRSPVKDIFIDVFADAAVRPMLEQHILDRNGNLAEDLEKSQGLIWLKDWDCEDKLRPKYDTLKEWADVVKYYSKLTSENNKYSGQVLKRVAKVVAEARTYKRHCEMDEESSALFCDPLSDYCHPDCGSFRKCMHYFTM